MSRSLAFAFTMLSITACTTATDDAVDVGSSTAELAATGPAGTMFTRPVPRTTTWTYNAEGIDVSAGGSVWRTG